MFCRSNNLIDFIFHILHSCSEHSSATQPNHAQRFALHIPVTQSDWEHLNFLRYGAVVRSPVSVQFFNASAIHDQSDSHDVLEGMVFPRRAGLLQLVCRQDS